MRREYICPSCRKIIQNGHRPFDNYTCEHCGDVYASIYIAGFSDGVRNSGDDQFRADVLGLISFVDNKAGMLSVDRDLYNAIRDRVMEHIRGE